jgi:hypothetical protein
VTSKPAIPPREGLAGARRSRVPAPGPTVVVAVLAALAVVVYGGYGRHWSWIGINGHTATLWDWLHLLLLPIAAVLLSLWLRHRARVDRWVEAIAAAAVAAFVVIVVAGYVIPWDWTGFVGNTLWDWLNLAALPLAVALIPVLLERRSDWGRRHAVALSAGVAVFLGLVLAGYLAKWRWTGFTGNTVWDWLHLLLLPLLVPAVIVPVLRPIALARLGVGGGQEPATAPGQPATAVRPPEPVAPAPPQAEAEAGSATSGRRA